MRNYLAIVFPDTTEAYAGLHALWELDRAAEITVHGTTVVHRGALGQIQVDSKETHPASATAIGVGIGAFLGLLAGPAGIAFGTAAGAVIGSAVGVAVGATVGGVVGAVTDLDRADTRNQATFEAEFALAIGQSAIIADVSESWLAAVDDEMKALGGTVYRRDRSALADDAWFGGRSPLYPYEYIPRKDTFFW